MGTTYKDFQTACTAFKNAHIDALGEQVDVFSLDTSYLLQGMIYDAKQVYKDKVIEKAKLSYGA